MKIKRVLWMAVSTALGLSALALRLAAVDTNVPSAKPGDSQDRPYKDLSPEQKQWKLKQIRETNGLPPLTAEDLRKLTPEERQAKIMEWRERNAPKFSPEELAKRRLQINDRLARQVSELQKKKANGSIKDDERRRLERLEELSARMKQRPVETGTAPGAQSNDPAAGSSPKSK
jgi:hypothetical protein